MFATLGEGLNRVVLCVSSVRRPSFPTQTLVVFVVSGAFGYPSSHRRGPSPELAARAPLAAGDGEEKKEKKKKDKKKKKEESDDRSGPRLWGGRWG